MRYLTALIAFTISAASPTAKKAEPVPAEHTPVIAKTPSLARIIQYGPRDTVRLTTRPLYVTTIVLPVEEKIAEYLVGDKDFWSISRLANIAWVKPTQNKTDTNVTLITLAGNVYSFHAVSDDQQDADFKIFIEPKDEGMLATLQGPARFVEASAVTGLKEELERTRLESYQVKKEAAAQIAEIKAKATVEAAAGARNDYKFASHVPPFNIAAMWHDDRFTYVEASPQELPVLYEIRDDKPNLVTWEYKNGRYTVTKILESGYFQMGKKKLGFEHGAH